MVDLHTIAVVKFYLQMGCTTSVPTNYKKFQKRL